MAVCRYCCREMTHTSGCDESVLHRGGQPAPRVPYGVEWPDPSLRCGDCGVVRGEYHHPGCDVERCATCGHQAIMCYCRYDEDPPDEDEWWDGLDEDEIERAVPAPVIDLFTRRQLRTAPLGFESIRPALQVRHGTRLDAVVAWAAAVGRDVDPDAVLLALAAALPHRTQDGSLLVRRPDVISLVHRVGFLAEDAGVETPLGVADAVAAVLEEHLAHDGLASNADPIEPLLEPLHAHFGLSIRTDGAHRCQCFAPHDPTAADSERLLPLRTGHIVRARFPDDAPAGADPAAAFGTFVDRLRSVWKGDTLDLDDIALLGWLPTAGRRPRLWILGRSDDPGRYDSLPLDDEGHAHLPTIDRRYRTGVRWDGVDCIEARWRCHLGEPRRRPALPVTWRL